MEFLKQLIEKLKQWFANLFGKDVKPSENNEPELETLTKTSLDELSPNNPFENVPPANTPKAPEPHPDVAAQIADPDEGPAFEDEYAKFPINRLYGGRSIETLPMGTGVSLAKWLISEGGWEARIVFPEGGPRLAQRRVANSGKVVATLPGKGKGRLRLTDKYNNTLILTFVNSKRGERTIQFKFAEGGGERLMFTSVTNR